MYKALHLVSSSKLRGQYYGVQGDIRIHGTQRASRAMRGALEGKLKQLSKRNTGVFVPVPLSSPCMPYLLSNAVFSFLTATARGSVKSCGGIYRYHITWTESVEEDKGCVETDKKQSE